MPNDRLSQAKSAKNDEFYPQYSDIEAEMNAYVEFDSDVFRGKTILLPCDDPEWSNFTKYFAYMVDNVMYVQTYPRILIRRKKGVNAR